MEYQWRPTVLFTDLSILLVEDHQVVRQFTAELLASEGVKVCVAATGRDAIRLLSAGNHQVLLLI